MLQFIVEVFVLLHGMVHLLYFGQSRRLFELKPGIVWPDGSWEFSKLLGAESTRILASICCVVAAITFIAGGLGLFIGQGWSRPVIIAAAVLSAVSFILFWDGRMQALADSGAIGLLLDPVLLVILLMLQQPSRAL